MKVFLVRHGQSEGNIGTTHSGPTTPLSKSGVGQAKTVAKRLLEVDPDLVICSRYIRAMQTAKEIAKVLKKKIVYTPLLNEWGIPSELHGVERDSRKAAEIFGKLEKFSHDPNWHYSDEENTFELVKRAENVIKYLSSRKEEKVVVVSHAAFIRAIIHFAIFGPDAEAASRFRRTLELLYINNTGITELELGDGKVKRIITLNDHAHLR
jgi:2,3-bisphosphoglycerate-dependent phosphoglycerate mutase